MKIDAQASDQVLIAEIGQRLAHVRLNQNLTQAALAEKAGVSKRMIERLEAGTVATQLSGFIRVLRALGLVEGFETLVPELSPSVIAQLQFSRKRRRRASTKSSGQKAPAKKWTWGEDQ